MKKIKSSITRPFHILRRLGGWSGGSIGQMEALAGVNVHSHAERTSLWAKFQHLFSGPSQQLVDAVMDHCAAIALDRINRGDLSLIPVRF